MSLFAPRIGLGIAAVLLAATSWAPSARAGDDKGVSAALRLEAERCLKLKKSAARLRLGVVIHYAEQVRQTGDTKTARRILERVTKVDPWAMDAHLMLAEMDKEKGLKGSQLQKKVDFLLKHAETGIVRTGALELIGRTADAKIPPIERLGGDATKIVLLPIGPVDPLLLKAAAEQVMRHLHYPVLVQQAGLELPEGGDNPLEGWFTDLRAEFRPVAETPAGQKALEEAGLDASGLSSIHAFLRVYRAWLVNTARWRDLSDFDARLHGATPPLWTGDTLNRHLAGILGPYGGENFHFIGVTEAEMITRAWRGGERPGLSWGGKGAAVCTYGPLRAVRTGEKPDWDRLVARTAKQIICAAGSSFAVRRCKNAKCPMRIVRDVREVDQKKLDPCKNCAGQVRGR